MATIYTLCELSEDDSITTLCWSADKQELVDEAWRREWTRYKTQKAKDTPGGPLTLSPNETKFRAFTVEPVRQFDASMKTIFDARKD